MCGIAGYIGKSKKPKITYELATCLFDYLELRGTDAAGIWGTDKKNRIIYHKEPGRSSQFIKQDIWKNVEKSKPNLLLMHARATSPGVGHASQNINNHPFVSADHRIGMIHNGRVSEADFLKKKYKIRSDTDSEVLLRMYEHGVENQDDIDVDADPDIAMRLKGLRDIWSLVHEGAMAVAFGEYIDEDTRHLYLFRNQHRPLWIADVRDTLGQIFFFSSPEIWYRAIGSSDVLRNACESMNSLIEIQVGQIWFFKVDKEHPCVGYGEESYCKFDVEVSDTSVLWEEGDTCEIKEPILELPVISQLDDNDRVVYSNKSSNYSSNGKKKHQPQSNLIPQQRPGQWANSDYWDDEFNHKGTEHEEIINDIDALLTDFGTELGNSFIEGSLRPQDYEDALESLRHIKEELENASMNNY